MKKSVGCILIFLMICTSLPIIGQEEDSTYRSKYREKQFLILSASVGYVNADYSFSKGDNLATGLQVMFSNTRYSSNQFGIYFYQYRSDLNGYGDIPFLSDFSFGAMYRRYLLEDRKLSPLVELGIGYAEYEIEAFILDEGGNRQVAQVEDRRSVDFIVAAGLQLLKSQRASLELMGRSDFNVGEEVALNSAGILLALTFPLQLQ